MALTLTPYDSAAYLRSEADIAAYLSAVAQEGDAALLIHALGVVARARGMSRLARDSGVSRVGLIKALSPTGNPSFATVAKAAKALGLAIRFQPIGKESGD